MNHATERFFENHAQHCAPRTLRESYSVLRSDERRELIYRGLYLSDRLNHPAAGRPR